MHLKLEYLVNDDIKLVIHLIEEFIKLQELSCHFTGSPGNKFVDLFLNLGNHLTLYEIFVQAELLIFRYKGCDTFRNSLQLVVANLDFFL